MSYHKSYIAIKTTQIVSVDFAEVLEKEIYVRYSLDSTEFIVKWVVGDPPIPDSIEAIPSEDKSEVMDYTEVIALIGTPEWTEELP